jgi:preprotein translocase SecY subunit
MSAFREFIRNASSILPEVPKPVKKPSFNEKLIWTGIALAIYLIMAQTPLFGVPEGLQDQFAMARVIFASTKGTLMELGIGPIVTAGLIMQLLKGAEFIKVDFKKPEDRAFFTSATKLATLVIALFEASAFALGGVFGPNLPLSTLAIILIQLFSATVIVMLLDELIQKGWGLGSGISLFILAGVAQTIMWDIFSPIMPGGEYLGIALYAVSTTIAGRPEAAFFRQGNLPSLFSLILTIIIILIIVYIEGMRVEIPVTSARHRGFAGVYPIKLLYVSNIPVILTSALMANVLFLSQLLWSRYNQLNSNPYLNWLATFNATNPGQPIGGLLYYITSPGSPQAAFAEPIRSVTYTIFIVTFVVIFGKLWVEIGGLSPKAVAKSLIDAEVQVPGFRRAGLSIEAILSKYIPPITIIGAIIIGLLASVADLLGAFGTGIGILLMIDIIIQYYQILVREHLETVMPRLGAFLGRR